MCSVKEKKNINYGSGNLLTTYFPNAEIVKMKKSRYFLIISIIFFLLMMSLVFFWYGNNASGILIISIPAMSLLISTCCYMVSRKQDINAVMDPVEEMFIGLEGETTLREPNPINDRPPSYRMTWRRSFIKRFKNRTEPPPPPPPLPQTEMQVISTSSSPVAETPRERQERPSRDETGSDGQRRYLAFSGPEGEFGKVYVEEEEGEGVVDVNLPATGEARSDQTLERRNSLPTYDEAMEIIRSRNDLTEE